MAKTRAKSARASKKVKKTSARGRKPARKKSQGPSKSGRVRKSTKKNGSRSATKKATRKPAQKSSRQGEARRIPLHENLAETYRVQSELISLKERTTKLEALLDVAKAMTLQRDLDALLEVILTDAASVLGCDRCTIWIVDRDRKEMWTKAAQGLNKSDVIRIPVGLGIAGQVAETGEIINIPDAYSDPRFNRQVDKDTGYLTRNILAVPMRHTTGEVTGVVQALNKLDGQPFTEEDEELFLALGANAAAAIENARLYEDIDQLFEGFVKASVIAIESRDPTTSGHSERVATLTMGIAEMVDRCDSGTYKETTFSTGDMREIRYAALLHDFGKVGVRENVLTKAQKLYPEELKILEARFHILALQRENLSLREIIDTMDRDKAAPPNLRELLAQDHKELHEFLEFIRKCNQPTVLDSSGFERLSEIAKITYTDVDGTEQPVLPEFELNRLSIPRGSLDPTERLEIESHVTHTYRFLTQIPWTRDLKRIPDIAYAHHEKLDGGGYPRKLGAPEIPVQARMMTIADIYDALTASDRPYKKAVPHEKAVDILGFEAINDKIDRDLLQIFIDAKLHTRVM